ncbi:hypothetical protein [Mangrovihabitans endophyticus]|uniref:Uncharacterized protein n=1 Tax=Mangrovihabitans endophyticus TaxID=1751298 RepID=A0A8J3C8N9_9ACTN|nr:hypothetical protein [Mangrovihabitans endophyticus]GGL20309.1 hypothetical protein GCM10012284_63670 [Mangrovihabitans endophyticus]
MTFPHVPQPGPRPGPPPGPRPAPPPAHDREVHDGEVHDGGPGGDGAYGGGAAHERPAAREGSMGHPAVDAVMQSLANAARLAPADQIAEYEAAHRVLQETLASIDR